MPPTPTEARELAKLDKTLRKINGELSKAIATEAPTAPILARFDKASGEMADLRIRIFGRDHYSAWQTDRALREAARHQVEAGKRILSQVMKSKRVLRAKSGQALQSAIRSEMRKVTKATQDATRSAALDIAMQAETSARLGAIQAFGAKGLKSLEASLQIHFGTGLNRAFVNAIWKEHADQLTKALGSNSARLSKAAKLFVAQGRDARKALASLESAGFPPAQMRKWADELVAMAREAATQAPGARKAFDAAARRARAVSALPRTRTGVLGTRSINKKLIADLRKAVSAHDSIGINAAIDTYMGSLTEYQAATAMRSVTNESYRRAVASYSERMPFIYAERRVLSTSHKRLDYCDGVASNDIGLGPGVYPIGDLPLEHMAGLCRDEPVIDKRFLKSGAKPLSFKTPKGYASLRARLSHDGALAKQMNKLGRRKGATKASITALLKRPSGKIKLTRGASVLP